jgi:hypothetical protein
MSKPIDIDNKELVFYHRQKLIVKILLKVSAEEIASIISQLVVENCNGCMTEHLSQTHHQCFRWKEANGYVYTLIMLWKRLRKQK